MIKFITHAWTRKTKRDGNEINKETLANLVKLRKQEQLDIAINKANIVLPRVLELLKTTADNGYFERTIYGRLSENSLERMVQDYLRDEDMINVLNKLSDILSAEPYNFKVQKIISKSEGSISISWSD